MAQLVDPDFRARLRALNEKYAAGVPALMRDIEQALLRCQAEGPEPVALAQLHQGLHAVAGSAATFGFGALGQECRRLEQRLRPLLRDGSGVDAQWPALAAAVWQLLDWAARNPRAQPYDGAGN